MKQKKTPMRKSLVSNEQFPKKDLLRIAYIAILNKEAREAKKKRVFDRAFQTKIADEFYDELITYVEHLVARRELESATYSADLAPDYD